VVSEERHERDHEFISEIRGALRFVMAILGINLAGVVYLVWHGIRP
jgi:hypothetical protein